MKKRLLRNEDLIRDAFVGAAGGLAGTLAMPYVTSALYKRESAAKKEREEQARKEPPFRVLAGRIVQLFGLEATDHRKKLVGQAVHWGYGMAWGAVYGVLRRRYPVLARAWGLPFALAFTLIGDEAMNTLMGLTPPPREFPVDAHCPRPRRTHHVHRCRRGDRSRARGLNVIASSKRSPRRVLRLRGGLGARCPPTPLFDERRRPCGPEENARQAN